MTTGEKILTPLAEDLRIFPCNQLERQAGPSQSWEEAFLKLLPSKAYSFQVMFSTMTVTSKMKKILLTIPVTELKKYCVS